MKAVIYTRVSTEDQARDGFSLQGQESALLDYAKKYGYNVVGKYTDEGVSGRSIKKRHGLVSLLNDAEKNKFDVVLIYKLDRLSRNVRDSYSIIDILSKHNIRLISFLDKDLNLDTALQRATFGIQTIFSQMEVEQTSERVIFGMREALKSRKNLGTPPIGYKIHDGEVIIDDEKSQLVIRIFNMYLNGYGVDKIARVLNQEGLRSNKNSIFHSSSISRILRNEAYTGKYKLYFKKLKQTDVVNNFYPVIIDNETFEKVQTLRKQKSNNSPNIVAFSDKTKIAIFTGVLYCNHCGGGVCSCGIANNKRRYSCRNSRYGKSVCLGKSFYEVDFEKLFTDYLSTLRTFYADKSIQIEFQNENQRKTLELKKELTTVKSKLNKNYYAWENDMIDDDFFINRQNELKSQEKELIEQLEKLNSDTNTTPKIFDLKSDFLSLWGGLNAMNKKKFILEFVESIHVETNPKLNISNIKFK